MTRKVGTYKLRKCSDVDRKYPIFEVVDETETAIMDFSIEEDSNLTEVLFYESITGRVMAVEVLQRIVLEGLRLLENEK